MSFCSYLSSENQLSCLEGVPLLRDKRISKNYFANQYIGSDDFNQIDK